MANSANAWRIGINDELPSSWLAGPGDVWPLVVAGSASGGSLNSTGGALVLIRVARSVYSPPLRIEIHLCVSLTDSYGLAVELVCSGTTHVQSGSAKY